MTVFVCQRHKIHDRVTGQLVDKYNLSDARRYGDLVYMIDHDADVRKPAPISERLANCLSRFSESDYLLLIGNPAIIGLSFAAAMSYSPKGIVKVLQWTPSVKRYLPLEFTWS